MLPLLAWLVLTACGGGRANDSAAAGVTPVATPSSAASANTGADSTVVLPAAALPALQAPSLPRAGLTAADLAVLITEGDPLSVAIALAYQRARGIPEANMVRVRVPAGSDQISAADFAVLKAAIDARLPVQAQAMLVTWTQPSRVVGSWSAVVI